MLGRDLSLRVLPVSLKWAVFEEGLYVPNYEYQCTACSHRFELWQNVGEAAPACPECGEAVKKVFNVPRVIFKGSGLYVTDLRAEKGGNKSEATGEAKSESGGDSTPKSSPATSSSSESTSSGSSSTTPASSSSPASATGDAK